MNLMRDPLSDIEDLPAFTPIQTREELFRAAKRGFVRIRKDFVQREEKPRPSILGQLVGQRKERPLELLLTIHALQPILEGSPLPLATWATLLDSVERPCTVRTVTAALRFLEDMELLAVEGKGPQPVITLKRENGDGAAWTNGRPAAESQGRGFFTVPFQFWTEGAIDKLRLPGKAMLLILLKETQDPNGELTFTMPVERAMEWYGISERTAERGYLELARKGYMSQKVQKIPDPRHPAGRREIHHRALLIPYSTDYREYLRAEASIAATGSTVTMTGLDGPGRTVIPGPTS